jgi:hypothetical protein
MAKKSRNVRVRKAVANNGKRPKRNASSVAKGAAYAVLAGRPSKQAVIAVFGKSGYALSWVARADRLGVIGVRSLATRKSFSEICSWYVLSTTVTFETGYRSVRDAAPDSGKPHHPQSMGT